MNEALGIILVAGGVVGLVYVIVNWIYEKQQQDCEDYIDIMLKDNQRSMSEFDTVENRLKEAGRKRASLKRYINELRSHVDEELKKAGRKRGSLKRYFRELEEHLNDVDRAINSISMDLTDEISEAARKRQSLKNRITTLEEYLGVEYNVERQPSVKRTYVKRKK